MDSTNQWHKFFIEMSEFVSRKSKDRSTKVGAVIVGVNNEVLSIGYHGFPRGVDDEREEYHERPTKYLITEHAERNAIFNAARQGIRLEGSTLFLHYEPSPCVRCSRAIIQSGIRHIIGSEMPFPGKGTQWRDDRRFAEEMLDQAGILRTTVFLG